MRLTISENDTASLAFAIRLSLPISPAEQNFGWSLEAAIDLTSSPISAASYPLPESPTEQMERLSLQMPERKSTVASVMSPPALEVALTPTPNSSTFNAETWASFNLAPPTASAQPLHTLRLRDIGLPTVQMQPAQPVTPGTNRFKQRRLGDSKPTTQQPGPFQPSIPQSQAQHFHLPPQQFVQPLPPVQWIPPVAPIAPQPSTQETRSPIRRQPTLNLDSRGQTTNTMARLTPGSRRIAPVRPRRVARINNTSSSVLHDIGAPSSAGISTSWFQLPNTPLPQAPAAVTPTQGNGEDSSMQDVKTVTDTEMSDVHVTQQTETDAEAEGLYASGWADHEVHPQTSQRPAALPLPSYLNTGPEISSIPGQDPLGQPGSHQYPGHFGHTGAPPTALVPPMPPALSPGHSMARPVGNSSNQASSNVGSELTKNFTSGTRAGQGPTYIQSHPPRDLGSSYGHSDIKPGNIYPEPGTPPTLPYYNYPATPTSQIYDENWFNLDGDQSYAAADLGGLSQQGEIEPLDVDRLIQAQTSDTGLMQQWRPFMQNHPDSMNYNIPDDPMALTALPPPNFVELALASREAPSSDVYDGYIPAQPRASAAPNVESQPVYGIDPRNIDPELQDHPSTINTSTSARQAPDLSFLLRAAANRRMLAGNDDQPRRSLLTSTQPHTMQQTHATSPYAGYTPTQQVDTGHEQSTELQLAGRTPASWRTRRHSHIWRQCPRSRF